MRAYCPETGTLVPGLRGGFFISVFVLLSVFWVLSPDALATPLDAATTDEKMTAASRCSPDRWGQCESTVAMRGEPPKGAGVGQQVEVYLFTTVAGARQHDVPLMALLSDYIGDLLAGKIRRFFDGLELQPPAREKPQPKPFKELKSSLHFVVRASRPCSPRSRGMSPRPA